MLGKKWEVSISVFEGQLMKTFALVPFVDQIP